MSQRSFVGLLAISGMFSRFGSLLVLKRVVALMIFHAAWAGLLAFSISRVRKSLIAVEMSDSRGIAGVEGFVGVFVGAGVAVFVFVGEVGTFGVGALVFVGVVGEARVGEWAANLSLNSGVVGEVGIGEWAANLSLNSGVVGVGRASTGSSGEGGVVGVDGVVGASVGAGVEGEGVVGAVVVGDLRLFR